VYSQSARLARLPAYLTVHMVRFYWRADIGKKAKIMRRVKFPTEYDVSELCTPELQAQIRPVARKLSELERDRAERRKVRKRTKAAASAPKDAAVPAGADVEMTEAEAETSKAGAELEDEAVYRERERKELEELVSPALRADTGCSVSGLYDLVGMSRASCVANARADAGHSDRDAQGRGGGRGALHRLREAERVPPGRGGRGRGLVQVRRRQGERVPSGEARDA
jgi:ubiquitin carboxyl-terminal hydrolase 14